MQMNLLSNKFQLQRARRWLVREHRLKLTSQIKQVNQTSRHVTCAPTPVVVDMEWSPLKGQAEMQWSPDNLSGWEAKEANLHAADSVLSPYKHVFNDKSELELEKNIANAILRRHILIGLSQDTTWETSVKILLKDGVNIHPAAVKAFGPKQPIGPVSNSAAAVADAVIEATSPEGGAYKGITTDNRPQWMLQPWATDAGGGRSPQQP
ncbi:hypothetical protein VOLCADRAFT_98365 [Volvox carteri f. nagariensis]|uniref:Uncharacterized protein n=1 Tax=Volvox carteri f. nagariensis TaxID=3068 RepID=D8UF56_VOLCA|nr:uncharacterized protein VOLCADRAFT_98365 [Volvox carteri f. nagariensis]EFJ41658.1 hypothetical protein VOLCADRAFT_98365 [Volvox carteri f. nagariensis]|eukprot:XP_002957314.1 hypothetical protein VOLCADRAFT_98365 [Volvox carteri f. nagariensis]